MSLNQTLIEIARCPVDYAKDCENAVQTEYERLEMVAKKEEERLELLLSDDHAIYDLIEKYDLYSELGDLLRAYNRMEWLSARANIFIRKLLQAAEHSVEGK